MKRLSGKTTTASGSEPFLFDLKPIELHSFKLSARSAVPVGRPNLKQFTAILQFAVATEESSPYWVGDLLNYSDTREDWKDKIDQVIAIVGIARQTAINRSYIAKHVDEEMRAIAPSLSHAADVAPLPPAQQRKLLTQAREEGLTRSELRRAIRISKRAAVIEGQTIPNGKYRVIYADPPWQYGDSGVINGLAYGKAEGHYPTMAIEDICKLPVQAHTTRDAVLFLWVTAPLLLQNPGPREVIEAWGFTYKTNLVWHKVLHNFGHYTSVRHEHLIIATRGSCTPDITTDLPDSVQTIRRGPVHSEKPEEFRRIIRKLYRHGPYLELFARTNVPDEGWTAWGNDAKLWGQEARA